jgi:hypothetical protein
MDPSKDNASTESQSNMDTIKENVSALADSAKATLLDAAEPVKEKALEVAAQKKDLGADQIRVVATAVHGAASALESEMPQFAGYIHDAGQRLEKAASELRDGDMDEIMSKLGQFARNQPAIVFGGAMIAGFALSRFLKSSAQQPNGNGQGSYNQRSYSQGSNGQRSYGQSSSGQRSYGQSSSAQRSYGQNSYGQGSSGGYPQGGNA